MKVFLSSTAEDLSEYRKVADDTILRLSQESIVMERFGPHSGTPLEECERMARESDVVICIVAHRYGSIPEGAEASFTQREVEAAHKAGKKVLAWIVEDGHPWTEKTEQDLFLDPTILGNPTHEAEVKDRISKLIKFKTWLGKTVISESFTTAEDLGRKIAIALQKHTPKQPVQPIPQDKISIARLPTTSANLFGREAELKILDDAWANPDTNIVSFIAWGGVGKTALVNHWLKQSMARDNYRDAERVYGWSFFSQGTSERAASADLFIDQALRWLGDPDPTTGSPWDKGERLARYVRQSRTLLILDGLEPLQYPPGAQEGRLKDPALQALLVELAAQNPGLCVISTRERIDDLVEFENSTVLQHDLEQLSPQAGAQLLRSLKAKGEDHELEEAVSELKGHAFSLLLLGSYLDEVLNGDIRRRKEIENLFDDSRYGFAAQRMIAAYEKWLDGGLELAIWRLLGFFNRPADLASIIALREPPIISDLTELFQNFKGRTWNQAVAKLRRIKLLAETSPSDPGTLEAHPLVCEYFKQQLKHHHWPTWREGNNRLYEYLKNSTPERPRTVEELSRLFAAVAHGCEAKNHEKAFHEIIYTRLLIWRGKVLVDLGAYSATLAALSGFFETPWKQPLRSLSAYAQTAVLNIAGFCLRALGRLEEATDTTHLALDLALKENRGEDAAANASNLGELYMSLGNLVEALKVAEQGCEFNHTDKRLSIDVRTTLAEILHQMGRDSDAYDVFQKAELMQRELESHRSFLYSLRGFRYCALLIEQNRLLEVKDRAIEMLEVAQQHLRSPLEIALANITLARVGLRELELSAIGLTLDVETLLNLAVDGFRNAATIHLLPHGLLARARFSRLSSEFNRAERDLTEALHIALRSGMRLHSADCHLESSRLELVRNHRNTAREHLATAKEIINRVGYHRRDKEVAELEAQLG